MPAPPPGACTAGARQSRHGTWARPDGDCHCHIDNSTKVRAHYYFLSSILGAGPSSLVFSSPRLPGPPGTSQIPPGRVLSGSMSQQRDSGHSLLLGPRVSHRPPRVGQPPCPLTPTRQAAPQHRAAHGHGCSGHSLPAGTTGSRASFTWPLPLASRTVPRWAGPACECISYHNSAFLEAPHLHISLTKTLELAFSNVAPSLLPTLKHPTPSIFPDTSPRSPTDRFTLKGV